MKRNGCAADESFGQDLGVVVVLGIIGGCYLKVGN